MSATTTETAPEEVPPQTVSADQLAYEKRKKRTRRIPLLPALIFIVVVTQIPFLVTIGISLFRWNIMRPQATKFTWFSNYVLVVQDQRMRAAIVNTVTLTVLVVVGSAVLGTALALLLDRKFLGRGIVRTLLITPFLVMPVASALIWKHVMYNPLYGLLDGLLTGLNNLLGNDSVVAIDWVSEWPMLAVAVTLIWTWTPFMMLIILAGLQSQSTEILEAAAVDGAGPWRVFRSLTLPHLRPYIELAVILGTIYVSQAFDAIYTITQGGPGTATTTIPYEIYLTMFRKYEYGEAAAAGVIIVILTIIVSTFALRTMSTLLKGEQR